MLKISDMFTAISSTVFSCFACLHGVIITILILVAFMAIRG